MNVLIVEDEPMAQARLAKILTTKYPDMSIAGLTGSVKDTLSWLQTPGRRADIIFMDVELSDGNCFDIFAQYPIDANVIMTTAYDSYAVKAFEVNSVDYLLKPIEPAALDRAVERCRRQVAAQGAGMAGVHSAACPVTREYRDRLIVKSGTRIVPLRVSEIAYIYSEEKYTWLVTADKARYILDMTLDVMQEVLDPACFFRISRSCIIRMSAISDVVKYQGSRLKINPLPAASFEMLVSRSRVDAFLAWLEGGNM